MLEIAISVVIWTLLFSSGYLFSRFRYFDVLFYSQADRWIFIATVPLLITLVIYYLLLFRLPGNMVFGLLTVLVFGFGIFGLKSFYKYLYTSLIRIKSILEASYMGSLFIFIGVSFVLSLVMPVYSNDLSEYVMLSQYFAKGNAQFIHGERFFADSGFYYIGLHAPGFPLLGAFGNWILSAFNADSTVFIKSVTGVYGALILGVSYLFFKQLWIKPMFAIFPILLFSTSYGVIITLFKFHIDTLRIFSLMTCVYLILNKKKYLNIYYPALGLLCGLAAFIHSLNVFFVAILILSDFFFSDLLFHTRVRQYSFSLFFTLIFGGIYYLLDITIGNGWILSEF